MDEYLLSAPLGAWVACIACGVCGGCGGMIPIRRQHESLPTAAGFLPLLSSMPRVRLCGRFRLTRVTVLCAGFTSAVNTINKCDHASAVLADLVLRTLSFVDAADSEEATLPPQTFCQVCGGTTVNTATR